MTLHHFFALTPSGLVPLSRQTEEEAGLRILIGPANQPIGSLVVGKRSATILWQKFLA